MRERDRAWGKGKGQGWSEAEMTPGGGDRDSSPALIH